MMKSLTSAGVVASLIVATIAGLKVRNHSDMPDTTGDSLYDLVASKGQEANISEADYYREVTRLLKDRYVEPITDDQKLLTGAVRGMILGLGDGDSQFFNPNEFGALKSIRSGVYTGVGAYFDFRPVKATIDEEKEIQVSLPRLAVVSVVPGSAAAKAGVKVGDIVTELDGHNIPNPEDYLKYRKAQADFFAKKIDFKTINDMRKDLNAKTLKAMSAVHAKEKLITGTTGTVKVKFDRDGKTIDTSIAKGTYEVPALKVSQGAFVLVFNSGAPSALQQYIEGKSEVTLDLRNNIMGDFETMRKCLSVIAPAATYGYFENQNMATPLLLKTSTGNTKKLKVKLVVDPSTRDAAEIFALALSSKGYATLSGSQMGNKHKLRDITQLPDGSGYTLVTGEFKPGNPPKKADKVALNETKTTEGVAK